MIGYLIFSMGQYHEFFWMSSFKDFNVFESISSVLEIHVQVN